VNRMSSRSGRKKTKGTHIVLDIDPACADPDNVIRDGFTLSDGRVTRSSDDGSTAATDADVSARYVPLSARIRHGFEALEPPLYDDDERPTLALAAWFADVAGELRLSDIRPKGNAGWRFSIVLAAPDKDKSNAAYPAPVGAGGWVVAMNLVEAGPAVTARLDLVRPATVSRASRVAVTAPVPSQTVLVVGSKDWGCTWRVDGVQGEVLAVLLASSLDFHGTGFT
jgi:hypothetical protein